MLKDRKVAFDDLDDENGEEIGVGIEDAAFESKEEIELLNKVV